MTILRFAPLVALIALHACDRPDPPAIRAAPDTNAAAPPPIAPEDTIVVDSDLTFEEAVAGLDFPEEIRETLVLIDVTYRGFDDSTHRGQILVRRDLAPDLEAIFAELYEARFPIEKVRPIVHYGWNDDSSMADNNTTCFHYRRKTGGRTLSDHAYGRAIDVNPWQNPLVRRSRSYPDGASYDPTAKGAIARGSLVEEAFRKRGWRWGGRWRRSKDYQHFYKR
jgi:peptidoglycan LD-endopeptidase CwlK